MVLISVLDIVGLLRHRRNVFFYSIGGGMLGHSLASSQSANCVSVRSGSRNTQEADDTVTDRM